MLLGEQNIELKDEVILVSRWITIKSKGNFDRLSKYLSNASKGVQRSTLERFGEQGVEALEAATPIDTGKTASSWYYKIEMKHDSLVLSFHNTNIQNGVPIAIILQYGHGTGNGGYVAGRDYINPAIQPVFDKIAKEAWKEVAGE